MESPAEMLDEQISSSLFDAAPMLRDRNVQEEEDDLDDFMEEDFQKFEEKSKKVKRSKNKEKSSK